MIFISFLNNKEIINYYYYYYSTGLPVNGSSLGNRRYRYKGM